MPEIQFYKTKDVNKILTNKNEDSLFIVKGNGNSAKIYYDYDNETRLEIGSIDNVLYTNVSLSEKTATVSINNFFTYKSNGDTSIVASPYSEIEDNKLVFTSNQALYVIKKINLATTIANSTITLAKLYQQEKPKWNEYF